MAGLEDTGPCLTCFSLVLANAEVFSQVPSLLLTFCSVGSPPVLPQGSLFVSPLPTEVVALPLGSRALYFSLGTEVPPRPKSPRAIGAEGHLCP